MMDDVILYGYIGSMFAYPTNLWDSILCGCAMYYAYMNFFDDDDFT